MSNDDGHDPTIRRLIGSSYHTVSLKTHLSRGRERGTHLERHQLQRVLPRDLGERLELLFDGDRKPGEVDYACMRLEDFGLDVLGDDLEDDPFDQYPSKTGNGVSV